MKVCPQCDHHYQDTSWLCPACKYELPVINNFHALVPQLAREGDGFHPEYFETLANLESEHFWFQARNRLIVDSLRRYFPDMKSFLEVGCGTGFVLSGVSSVFSATQLTGTEIFSEGLTYASSRVPHADFLQMDARQIPYSAEFDVIGAFDVLEHIKEDELVISQMYEAIRPGGGLVVTVPQHDWMWSKQDELACHVRRYSVSELRSKLSSAGFHVIEARSFVSLLLPVLWLTRRFGNAHARIEDPLSELRLSSLTNRLLGGIMRFERAIGSVGISLPVGGSLLLVAIKNENSLQ